MTHKTDIASLMRDMRDLADRIVECQGENSDGEEITRLYDQSDTTFKAQNILLVMSALETERQRVAEITEQYVDSTTALSFATQRAEAAEKSNAFLKAELAKLANFNPDWDMLEACRESWREVVALLKEREAELTTLKAKLANPVVLPTGYSTRAGHPFHEGERNVMIPNKHGDWLSRFDVEHALHVAGFKVECGETAPQKPVALAARTRNDYDSRLGNGDIGPYNHGHLEGWNECHALFAVQQKPVISKEKLCDWLEDNFDIDDSQRDAFAECFAHHCNCIVKDGD